MAIVVLLAVAFGVAAVRVWEAIRSHGIARIRAIVYGGCPRVGPVRVGVTAAAHQGEFILAENGDVAPFKINHFLSLH